MKLLKYLLVLLVAGMSIPSMTYAADEQDGSRFEEELNERDFDALRDFLNTKRRFDVAEKASDLRISADVRTEWRHLNEKLKGVRLRGGNATEVGDLEAVFGDKCLPKPSSDVITVPNNDPTREPTRICKRWGRPISRNDFDLEFNLKFDYVMERAWASAHLQFDNSGGVDDNDHPCCLVDDEFCEADPEGYHGSGHCDDICLRKAYMGYNIWSNRCSRLDIELGRRGNLYHVFDSKVQFLSRFDGLLIKYDSALENITDWYIHAAGFLVDERVNHFAWVAELGLINIYDTNIDFKYSIIDWRKHGKNRCFVYNPKGFRFLNSQFTAAYNITPDFWPFPKCLCVPAKLYGAFLCNHLGDRVEVVDRETGASRKFRENLAWYLGFTFGKVVKEGDWAIDIQYQVVQAFAVPDGDVAGICNGNVLDESITTCANRGNTNYQGWRLEGLYALTDNLTLDTIIEWSKAYQKKIGGSHTYSKLEVEAIYAF